MSYEEIVNGANNKRRELRCRQEWMLRMAMQWGGWLLAGLILMANLVTAVH